MSITITRARDGHRAARFVLAAADSDWTKITDLMREVAQDDDDRSMLFLALELSSISIGIAEKCIPSWRGVLGNALLDIEVTHLDQSGDDARESDGR